MPNQAIDEPLCSKCGQNPASDNEHPCPFQCEINDDCDDACYCCHECENECMMDV